MPDARILFVDAYDSFSASITALLQQVSQSEVTTVKIDTNIYGLYGLTTDSFLSQFDAIVLGPGPGQPDNANDVGLFNEVWQVAEREQIPVLGICLGFQHLCLRYGLPVERMPMPCHGHARHIQHEAGDIFNGTGEIFATQYNSLGVSLKHWHENEQSQRRAPIEDTNASPDISRPPSVLSSRDGSESDLDRNDATNDLKLLAWNDDNYAMAVRHRIQPFWGMQFHPESCKSSKSCHTLLQNWFAVTRSCAKRSHSWQSPKLTIQQCSSTRQNTSTSDLVETLCRVVPATANQITSHTIALQGSSASVRDFCYSLSESLDTVLLESTRKGRYSIYGVSDDTTVRIEVSGSICSLKQSQSKLYTHHIGASDTLAAIEELILRRQVYGGAQEVPFWGGFAGFLSYECGLKFLAAEKATCTTSQIQIPDINMIWIDRSIILDHDEGTMTVQSIRLNDKDWVEHTTKRLQQLRQEPETGINKSAFAGARYHLPVREGYLRKVLACQSELMAGNSYELCLTTEAKVQTPLGKDHPFNIYKNIQLRNPVPYAGFLRLGDTTIVCSSPEKFLSWSREGVLDMVPMKGTVKKSPDMTLEKATAILSTPKETAENLMIADLIRHDLYNVVGQKKSRVEVVKLCEVVEHETVYQLVSHIRALSESKAEDSKIQIAGHATRTGCRALRCTLPPGSMTGAPKKRSCEILGSLEQRRRGVYSGVIGFFDVGGGGAWNVCIRSAFSHKVEDENGMQTWHIGAGGAITVLSDPESEWEEMQTKLESILRGFQIT